MIGIQTFGRLGNQMFQYASARALAEKLGCGLLAWPQTPTRRFGIAGRLMQLDSQPFYRDLRQNGLLHDAFGCGPAFFAGRAIEIVIPAVRAVMFPRRFTPRLSPLRAEGEFGYEEFDDRFFDVRSGTMLKGLFQSSEYFASSGESVRHWFRPKPLDAARIQSLIEEWPQPPRDMAAIHVRRGDYAMAGGALSHPETGWLLPLSYYRDAMAQLPSNAGLAIFSDDPDWAAEQFRDRRPWVSRGNSALIDMMLMARCRTVIIANSSFSWWSAWLNSDTKKVIYAPLYHLGFRVGRWLPGGIEVNGWNYIPVKDA